jgi:hypothetical protein
MTTFTTITGKEIKVSANKSKRTFTIITNGTKYKTIAMTKDEFNQAEYFTANDWDNFLQKTWEYFVVR